MVQVLAATIFRHLSNDHNRLNCRQHHLGAKPHSPLPRSLVLSSSNLVVKLRLRLTRCGQFDDLKVNVGLVKPTVDPKAAALGINIAGENTLAMTI